MSIFLEPNLPTSASPSTGVRSSKHLLRIGPIIRLAEVEIRTSRILALNFSMVLRNECCASLDRRSASKITATTNQCNDFSKMCLHTFKGLFGFINLLRLGELLDYLLDGNPVKYSRICWTKFNMIVARVKGNFQSSA